MKEEGNGTWGEILCRAWWCGLPQSVPTPHMRVLGGWNWDWTVGTGTPHSPHGIPAPPSSAHPPGSSGVYSLNSVFFFSLFSLSLLPCLLDWSLVVTVFNSHGKSHCDLFFFPACEQVSWHLQKILYFQIFKAIFFISCIRRFLNYLLLGLRVE